MKHLDSFAWKFGLGLMFVVSTLNARRLELVDFSSKNFKVGESGELAVSYRMDIDKPLYLRWYSLHGPAMLPVISGDKYTVNNKFSEPGNGVTTVTVKNIDSADTFASFMLLIQQSGNSVWIRYTVNSSFGPPVYTTPAPEVADRALTLNQIKMNDIVPQKATFNTGDKVKLRCTGFVASKESVSWVKQSIKGDKFVMEFFLSNFTNIDVTTNFEEATSGEGFNMESVLTLTGNGAEDAGFYFCNTGFHALHNDLDIGASRMGEVLYSNTPLLGTESIATFFSFGFSSITEIPSELLLKENEPMVITVNVVSRNDVRVKLFHNGALVVEGENVKRIEHKEDLKDYKLSQDVFYFEHVASTQAGHYDIRVEDQLEGRMVSRRFSVTLSA